MDQRFFVCDESTEFWLCILFLALICSENLYLHSRTATLLTNCSVYGILNLQLHFYIGTAKCNFTFAFLKMILHVMTSHLLCVLSNGEPINSCLSRLPKFHYISNWQLRTVYQKELNIIQVLESNKLCLVINC